MVGKLLKIEKGHYILIDDKGFLIGTSRDCDVNKLSIKNCEAIERGYDLNELAKLFHEQHKFASSHIADITSFKYGFQKALDIINEARTHKDPQLIDSMALRYRHDFGMIKDESELNYLRTTMTQLWEEVVGLGFYDGPNKWNVEIEMEPYYDGEFIDDGKTHIVEPKWRPKFDEDSCLIVKRI